MVEMDLLRLESFFDGASMTSIVVLPPFKAFDIWSFNGMNVLFFIISSFQHKYIEKNLMHKVLKMN